MPENDPAIDFPFQKPECNRARKLWNVSLRRKSNKEGEIKYLSTRNRSMNKDKLARTPARASARASAHVVLGKFPPCSLTLRNSTHMHQNTATLLAIILVTSSAYATTRFSTNSHVRSLRLIPASLVISRRIGEMLSIGLRRFSLIYPSNCSDETGTRTLTLHNFIYVSFPSLICEIKINLSRRFERDLKRARSTM